MKDILKLIPKWLYGYIFFGVVITILWMQMSSYRSKYEDSKKNTYQHKIDSLNLCNKLLVEKINKSILVVDSLRQNIDQYQLLIDKQNKLILQIKNKYNEQIKVVNHTTPNEDYDWFNSVFTR